MPSARLAVFAAGIVVSAVSLAGAQAPATPRQSSPAAAASYLDLSRLDDTVREAHAAADSARGAGNPALAGRMNAFARQAAALRERAGDRRRAPQAVDRDLDELARQGRRLDRDVARNYPAGTDTRDGWTRVMQLVEGLRAAPQARGTSGVSSSSRPVDGRLPEKPPSSPPERERQAPGQEPAHGDEASLVMELDQRVRAAQALTDRLETGGETRTLAERFFQQAARFGADSSRLDPGTRGDRARTLLAEARRVQGTLTGPRASPEQLDAWNRVIETLALMGGK